MLGHGFSEDEEELPSLAFLLGLHHSLLPWGLPQSPVPASGLVCTAGQRAQQASQAPVPQRMGLSSGPLEAAKSRSGLGMETWLQLRTWPGLGLTCEALGGTPWL